MDSERPRDRLPRRRRQVSSAPARTIATLKDAEPDFKYYFLPARQRDADAAGADAEAGHCGA